MNLHQTKHSHNECRSIRPGPTGRILLAVAIVLVAVAGWMLPARSTAALQEQGTPPADSGSQFSYEDQTLRVNVWHDKDEGDVYRLGETVRIHFETNEDAHVVVYRIDADGKVTILWPRSRYDDGFVFGHHHYTLPASGAQPIRVSSEEGVEYVEAIASAYPFDLRELEVEFHHEDGDESYEFYVAGDPFLAMNEVNYTVTGLEDPSDYVVTNYSSYYVHERVDHPRYLCHQCHDAAEYRPYRDTCSLSIHYDFGWYNSWYVRFGYYPVYYYPAYYYVDPWSYRPWVNYWYTPWYYWPSYPCYTWSNSYYNWRYTPLARGDALVRYRDGDRRYRPLARDYRTKGDERERYKRRENLMVASGEPTREINDAIRTRTRLNDRSDVTARDGRSTRPVTRESVYRDTKPTERQRVAFRDAKPVRSAPGLRIQSRQSSGPATRPVVRNDRARSSDSRIQDRERTPTGARNPAPGRQGTRERQIQDRSQRSPTQADGQNRRTIRSVEPRKSGSRIWTGGRNKPANDRTARPQQVKPGDRKSSSRSTGSRSSRVQPTRRGSSSSKSPGRSSTVKPAAPRRSGGSKSPPSRSSRSGSSRSGGSRTGGSRSGGRR